MGTMIVIGAGFAGLSTAIHARRRGHEVTVLERHTLPGGMCTSWKRRGYTFEGCFHYIRFIGALPGSVFYPVWKELGVLEEPPLIRSDILETCVDREGRAFRIFTDPAKLRRELAGLSPGDAVMARELCCAIRRCRWFTRDAGRNPFLHAAKAVNMVLALPFLMKYGGLGMAEYARRFRDPLIRKAIARLFEYGDISAAQLPMFLGMYAGEGVHFPVGGSLGLARAAERRLVKLGGTIEYGKRVESIREEDGKVRGVRLADGSLREADIVVAACDLHATAYELLGGRHAMPELEAAFREYPVYEAYLQVSLGLVGGLGLPPVARIETGELFTVAGTMRDELRIVSYDHDTGMAPPGHSSVVILYATDYARWEAMGHGTETYRAEKAAALEATLRALEERFPDIRGRVEATDVATPLTTLRYTGNWRSALGFRVTKDYIKELRSPRFELPGLEGFYQTGQWIVGMGVPNAALGGRRVVELIEEKRKRGRRRPGV